MELYESGQASRRTLRGGQHGPAAANGINAGLDGGVVGVLVVGRIGAGPSRHGLAANHRPLFIGKDNHLQGVTELLALFVQRAHYF